MSYGRVALAVAVITAVAGVAGCPEVANVDACEHPDYTHHDKDGSLDPCHCDDDAGSVGGRDTGYCAAFLASADAGDAAAEGPIPGCSGQCFANPPTFWTSPLLLWFGAETDAPACPDSAPALGFEGHADLDAPDTACGVCSCGAPEGSCELPATVTANAATCALTNATTAHTPFDPPAGWDGECTPQDSIPAGKLCSGVKCVQSLTLGPLTLNESGCAPAQQPVPQDLPSTWSTFARACTWTPPGTCASPGEICSPAVTLPAGFQVCVAHEGEMACPGFGPYQDKHVFYEGLDDTRSCSPCACGAAVGGECSGLISIYADATCSSGPLAALTVDATGPACADLPAGSALGSKSAAPPTYTPGVCAPSGGELMGSADPVGPVTFCCLVM